MGGSGERGAYPGNLTLALKSDPPLMNWLVLLSELAGPEWLGQGPGANTDKPLGGCFMLTLKH